MKFAIQKLSTLLFIGTGCVVSAKAMDISSFINKMNKNNLSIGSDITSAETLKEEINKQTTKIITTDSEIQVNSKKKEILVNEIETQTQKITTQKDTIDGLKATVNVIEKELISQNEKLNETQLEKQTTEQKVQTISQQITEVTEEITELTENIVETDAWFADLKETRNIKMGTHNPANFPENIKKIKKLLEVMPQIYEKDMQIMDYELSEFCKTTSCDNNPEYTKKSKMQKEYEKSFEDAMYVLKEAYKHFSNNEALPRELQYKWSVNSIYLPRKSQEVKNKNINYTNKKVEKTTEKETLDTEKINSEKQIKNLQDQELQISNTINEKINDKNIQESKITKEEIELEINELELQHKTEEKINVEQDLQEQIIEKQEQIQDMLDMEGYLD